MRVTKNYLETILCSGRFAVESLEGAAFARSDNAQSRFQVWKQFGTPVFVVHPLEKGTGDAPYATHPEPDYRRHWEEQGWKEGTGGYCLIEHHFHADTRGPIVPTPYEIETLSQGLRQDVREVSGYDVRPVLAIGMARASPRIDMLLVQETPNLPLGMNDLDAVADGLSEFHITENRRSAMSDRDSYLLSQEVAQALRDTGFYQAEVIRYRGRTPFRNDLDRLSAFAFDEIAFR